jgi:hypothetical protein
MFAAFVAVAADSASSANPDKYSLKVPGGMAFSDFRGYESWEVVNVSHGNALAVIVANPTMISAYKAGIPDNGRPFPDGSKMAKIHLKPTNLEKIPGPKVGGEQLDVDFMAKDSKRFADSGGWGYAFFIRDQASGEFRPADTTSTPPQGNDAKCGHACHTIVKDRDYVFTTYAQR